MEPLGLMYLSASAKRAGHETKLVTTSDNLETVVKEFKPQVIGYSVMTGDQDMYVSLNQRLKAAHNFLSIFGGPHPTFFPQLVEEPGVDVICKGEGEEAFAELLDKLQKGQPVTNIPNLSFNLNGTIQRNDLRPFSDLDNLAFPDRDLITNFTGVGDGPIKHFLASRGCPFSCAYCFNEQYAELYSGKGKRVRFRDVESVVAEVVEVTGKSPTKFVYFQDDTFTLNRDWLRQFSELYSRQVNLPFHCHVRPNTIDEEKINLLKNAGCYSVHIAAETADDFLRNEVLKRRMSKEQIYAACDMLKSKGIRFMLQNIIGLPGGSIEKDISTLEMNIRCNPDYAWVSIFQPYPGTSLGEHSKQQGFYTGDFKDLAANFFDSSKLNFPETYKNQLSNLQRLFAIFVEYPELHRLGLSQVMIDAPNSVVDIAYRKAYKEFRKKADERLFGFSL